MFAPNDIAQFLDCNFSLHVIEFEKRTAVRISIVGQSGDMKAFDSALSIFSLVAILAGLLVAASNEWGFLQNQKRIIFYHRVFYSSAAIPRTTDCFDDFLMAFPPPSGTSSTLVSGIAPRLLDAGNTGGDVWSSVRYTMNGATSEVVAIQPDVEKWAYKTTGTKIGLSVSFIGFLIGVTRHVVSRGTAKNIQKDAAPNSRPPSQFPAAPETRTSDSQRTPSSGGCG